MLLCASHEASSKWKALERFPAIKNLPVAFYSLQYWSGLLTSSGFSMKVKKVGKNIVLIWFGWDKPSCCIVQPGHAAVLTIASSLEGCWYKPRFATKEEWRTLFFWNQDTFAEEHLLSQRNAGQMNDLLRALTFGETLHPLNPSKFIS